MEPDRLAGDASDASWIRQVLGRLWDEEGGGSPALLSGSESCLHVVTLPGNTGGFSGDQRMKGCDHGGGISEHQSFARRREATGGRDSVSHHAFEAKLDFLWFFYKNPQERV